MGYVSGIRVITESVHPNSVSTSLVLLYANDRGRTGPAEDSPGGYQIERRDLKKRFTVYPGQKEYRELPLFDLISKAEKERFVKSGKHWRERYAPERPPSGAFRIRTAYEAMNDEEPIFGCVARRWKIIRRVEHDYPQEQYWEETISDAWYLDSEQLMRIYSGFSQRLIHETFCYVSINHDQPILENSGQKPSGLCARSESRMLRHNLTKNGEVRETEERGSYRISSLTEEFFPESLFEVPHGFRKRPNYPSRFTMARTELMRRLKIAMVKKSSHLLGPCG